MTRRAETRNYEPGAGSDELKVRTDSESVDPESEYYAVAIGKRVFNSDQKVIEMKGGKAYYDPVTNTLTLSAGSGEGITGPLDEDMDHSDGAMILCSSVEPLTIKGAGRIAYPDTRTGIMSEGDVVIDGDIDIEASCRGISSGGSIIVNGSLKAKVTEAGYGEGYALYSAGKTAIKAENASGTGVVLAAGEGIEIKGEKACAHVRTASENAIMFETFDGSELKLGDNISVTDPVGGTISEKKIDEEATDYTDYYVNDAKGSMVREATIQYAPKTDTELKAEAGKHLLVFYVDGELYDHLQAENGRVAPELSKADPEGNFLGWYIDGKALWDPTAPVTEDLKLYARFAATSASDNRAGESALDSQVELTAGKTLYLVKGQSFKAEGTDWSSNNISVLKFGKGTVTAKSPGSATLSNKEMSIDVIVTNPSMKNKKLTIVAGAEEETIPFEYDSSNYRVLWVSQDKDIVKVSADGKVYGIAKGSSTVTAYINGKAYNCKVTVMDADTAKRDWTKPVELVPLQKSTMKIKGLDYDKADWSSDMKPADTSSEKNIVFRDDVVSITKKGVVTAIGVGTTHVKVTQGDVEKVFTISVNQPVARVVHMKTGTKKKIAIYGVKKAIKWTPDDTGIASVDSKGKVNALKAGHTVLRHTEGSFNYTVDLYVEDISFSIQKLYGDDASFSGSGNKYKLNMKPGSAIRIKSDKTYQNVLFKSSKDSVVFADEAGVITARSAGKGKLTATVNGKKITVTVTVNQP